jgi:hypothetical protein
MVAEESTHTERELHGFLRIGICPGCPKNTWFSVSEIGTSDHEIRTRRR